MLKKLFFYYSDDKNSQGIKLINFRNLVRLCEDFNFFKNFNYFNKSQLQVIFSQLVVANKCEFHSFIEILYKIQKFFIQKIPQTQIQIEKKTIFKTFINESIIPIYKTIFAKLDDLNNIEKIQVFYQNYNQYENPTVSLLFESDDLLKHVEFLFIINILIALSDFFTLRNL